MQMSQNHLMMYILSLSLLVIEASWNWYEDGTKVDSYDDDNT